MKIENLLGHKEELIRIRNQLTEIRDKLKPEISNNIKRVGESDFSRLCLIINSLDAAILNIIKLEK